MLEKQNEERVNKEMNAQNDYEAWKQEQFMRQRMREEEERENIQREQYERERRYSQENRQGGQGFSPLRMK